MKNTILILLILLLVSCSTGPSLQASQPVTIKFAGTNRSINYDALVQDFQKTHPNITFELTNLSTRGQDQPAFLDALKAVDVIRMRMDFMQPNMLSNFLDLSPLIATDRNFQAGDFFPGTLDALKQGGTQLGIPAGISPYVVYYEPARYQRMGVTPPSSDWTLSDFENTAQAINDQETMAYTTDKFTYGFCSVPDSNDPLFFTYLFGGGLVDDIRKPTLPTLNTIENVQALQWYARLYQDLKVMPPEGQNGGVRSYTNSWVCGLWIDVFNANLSSQDGNHTAAMLPLPAYKTPFSAGTVDGYYILKSTQHPTEAWQWLSFLAENQAASGGQIPPLRSLAGSEGYKARVSATAFQIANSLPKDMVILNYEISNDPRVMNTHSIFLDAASQVVYNKADPLQALTDAQAKAEAEFMKPTPVILTPTP